MTFSLNVPANLYSMGWEAVYAQIFLFAAGYAYCLMNNTMMLRSRKTLEQPHAILLDFGFDLFGHWKQAKHPIWFLVSDVTPIASALTWYPLAALGFIDSPARIRTFIDMSMISGAHYLLKGLCGSITVIPDCRGNGIGMIKAKTKIVRTWRDVFLNVETTFYNDMMYSGHAFMICTNVLRLLEVFDPPPVIRALGLALIVFDSVSLVLFRIHYTVDVIVALLFSITVQTHPGLTTATFSPATWGWIVAMCVPFAIMHVIAGAMGGTIPGVGLQPPTGEETEEEEASKDK